MRCIKCGIPLMDGEDNCPICKTPITETINYYESQGYGEDEVQPDFELVEVDSFGNEDRGGFGTTGTK